MTGVQTSLASNFEPNSNYLKTDTMQDHQDILNLLRQMPKYLEEIQVLLEKGIESGLTHHEASMSRVPFQFETLLNYSKIEETSFYNPFKILQGDPEEVSVIQEEAKRVIKYQVMPAFEKLRGNFVRARPAITIKASGEIMLD